MSCKELGWAIRAAEDYIAHVPDTTEQLRLRSGGTPSEEALPAICSSLRTRVDVYHHDVDKALQSGAIESYGVGQPKRVRLLLRLMPDGDNRQAPICFRSMGPRMALGAHANYLYMSPYGPIRGPMRAHIKVVSMCPGDPNGTQDTTKYH